MRLRLRLNLRGRGCNHPRFAYLLILFDKLRGLRDKVARVFF